MLYANNRVRPSGHNVLDYLCTSYDCTVIKDEKPQLSRDVYIYIYINVCVGGGIVIDISSRSHELKRASSTHTTPRFATKVREV